MQRKPLIASMDPSTGTFQPVPTGTVRVWRISLADPSWARISPKAYLSAGEMDRADRFVVPQPRVQYVRSHIALRWLLAQELKAEPSQIGFVEANGGKPGLVKGGGLEFNLSHSGDLALIAVTREIPIGVDVEQHRPNVRVRDLAGRYFSSLEDAAIRETGGRNGGRKQRVLFFQIWTRKEACIKAWGEGLRTPLDSFDVLGEVPLPVRAQAKAWSVKDIPVLPGYSAAVCARGGRVKLEVLDWSPETMLKTTRNPNQVRAIR